MTKTQQLELPALLPCPFCGSEARIFRMRDESRWSHDEVLKTSVRCDGCDVATDYTEEGQDPEAVERWNTRAQAAVLANRESRKVVAWRYMPSPTWGEYVITQDPKVAEVARSMGVDVEELTVGATSKVEDKT